MNLNTKTNQKGFTIVELLIVIVVIGILAAITIVAYNGIQKRANASAAESAGNTLQKKAEAYNAVETQYPATSGDFNAVDESELTGSGITILGTPSAPNGKTTLKYEICDSRRGARITYWDYNTGALGSPAQILLGTATTAMTDISTPSCAVVTT